MDLRDLTDAATLHLAPIQGDAARSRAMQHGCAALAEAVSAHDRQGLCMALSDLMANPAVIRGLGLQYLHSTIPIDSALARASAVSGASQAVQALRRAIRASADQQAPQAEPDDRFRIEGLATNKSGKPLTTLGNCQTIVRRMDQFRTLWHDLHSDAVMWGDHEVTDDDIHEARLHIEAEYGVDFPPDKVLGSMVFAAKKNGRHPIREYLASLEWDGVERLRYWISDHCGAGRTTLTQAYGMRWMISAVARVYEPGCQADHVLVLQGPQGGGKSSAIRTLGGQWASDAPIDVRSKDAPMALLGSWLHEMAELEGMRRREAAAVKAFITSRIDRYRPPYGRTMVEQPRQCVFAATTNESHFLEDSTGSRRFWIVTVGQVHLQGLAAIRDQLWAEAVHLYRAGEPWHLTREEAAQQRRDNAEHEMIDPWHDVIADYLESPECATMVDTVYLLTQAIGRPRERLTRHDEMRVGAIMQALGYERARRRIDGVRRYVYVRA